MVQSMIYHKSYPGYTNVFLFELLFHILQSKHSNLRILTTWSQRLENHKLVFPPMVQSMLYHKSYHGYTNVFLFELLIHILQSRHSNLHIPTTLSQRLENHKLVFRPMVQSMLYHKSYQRHTNVSLFELLIHILQSKHSNLHIPTTSSQRLENHKLVFRPMVQSMVYHKSSQRHTNVSL